MKKKRKKPTPEQLARAEAYLRQLCTEVDNKAHAAVTENQTTVELENEALGAFQTHELEAYAYLQEINQRGFDLEDMLSFQVSRKDRPRRCDFISLMKDFRNQATMIRYAAKFGVHALLMEVLDRKRTIEDGDGWKL